MRLWSLHPRLLDRAALVACWREALLAQKVLAGDTKGYRHHPQLDRFRGSARTQPDSLGLIAAYLSGIADEADARSYRFDRSRILGAPTPLPGLTVTAGQVAFERDHLRAKVALRAPGWVPRAGKAIAHPLFVVVPGPVEPWERPYRRP